MSAEAHGIARDQLRAFIERIERLEEEKKTIADDIKDVYGEAKSMGFDTKIMKKVVALRKIDDQKRTEEDLVLDTYLSALGMIPQFEMFDGDEVKPSREDRRRQRTTEAMDDHKSLVDEMADAGLISEEARHENKALADAVATKFGNGPAMALQSPRKAAEAVSERTAFQVEDHSSAEATIEGQPSVTVATSAESAGEAVGIASDLPTNSPSKEEASSSVVPSAVGPSLAARDAEESAASNSPIAPASQGEAEAPSVESVSPETHGSSDANTGGEDVTLEQNAAPIQAGALFSENTPATPMHRNMFAHCWPDLTKAEYEELEDSISVIGIQEPIVRKGDIILDGWNRYNIARSLDEEYPVIEYDGSDELLDVIRWQRSSRDWTPQQEAKIAKALAAEVPARAEEIFAAFHIAELPDGEVVAA